MEIVVDKEPITVTGLQKLKAELENLKNIQRPKIVEAMRVFGILKWLFEYKL